MNQMPKRFLFKCRVDFLVYSSILNCTVEFSCYIRNLSIIEYYEKKVTILNNQGQLFLLSPYLKGLSNENQQGPKVVSIDRNVSLNLKGQGSLKKTFTISSSIDKKKSDENTR
jgi:ADP-glucose pyrophosphorylase